MKEPLNDQKWSLGGSFIIYGVKLLLINFNYNSLAANEYGWWKIDGGKVNFDFTGAVEYNSAYYTVVNGKVVF